MTAYYNEVDPFAAHLLRSLIAGGVIAPGDVDDRSIKEVSPDDLRGYTQCHFFAGGGLWSVAARLGGWPDDEPLWTGSCPCQPFSQAGKGAGIDDPRHLWPDFFRLVSAVRPPVVVGEQVAGAAGYGWLDGVLSDLAGEGYAGRGVDIPACSVDAPHIRQRLYWCALADATVDGREQGQPWASAARHWHQPTAADGGIDGPMSDADSRGRSGRQEAPQRGAVERAAAERADASGVAQGHASSPVRQGQQDAERLAGDQAGRADAQRADRRDGRPNGSFWADAEWLTCHDGKARRTKPGVCLLAHGVSGRVDLWRVAGNAIVPQVAAQVLASLREVRAAA
jgi:DNA (cytosine-5)-methyltransferase 1